MFLLKAFVIYVIFITVSLAYQSRKYTVLMSASVIAQQNFLDYLSSIIYSTYSILGIILNSSLLWLIFTQKHNFIKEYRILLANTTCTLVLHSLLTFFLQLRLVSAGDSLGYVALGPARFLDMPFFVLFCTSLWLAIEYYAFMTIAMCMVYRYATIRGRSLSERQLVAVSVVTFLLPLSTGISLLASNPDFSELHGIMDKLRPEYDLQRYGNYCGLPNVKNIFVMYLTVMICIIAIMSYIVMITVGLRTKNFLAERAEDLSTKNLQLFKMMIKALIIQALATVFFSLPHLFLYMLLQFTSFRCLAAEYIGVLISPLVIVVDPCITLYCVLPYRRYLLKRFGFVNETVSQTAVSTTAAADYIRNSVKE